MAGGVESTTDTVKGEHEATLLLLSFAVHVTVVLPRLKVLPENGTHDMAAMPALSVAPKFHTPITVGEYPLLGTKTMGELVVNGGHVRLGGVGSLLVMLNVQFDTFPELLVALHVTYTVPRPSVTGLVALQA